MSFMEDYHDSVVGHSSCLMQRTQNVGHVTCNAHVHLQHFCAEICTMELFVCLFVYFIFFFFFFCQFHIWAQISEELAQLVLFYLADLYHNFSNDYEIIWKVFVELSWCLWCEVFLKYTQKRSTNYCSFYMRIAFTIATFIHRFSRVYIGLIVIH